eukprot:scaffold151428_cov78-Attheya_sp.AAC.2
MSMPSVPASPCRITTHCQLFRAPYRRAYPTMLSLPTSAAPHLPEPISCDAPTRAYPVPRLPEPIPCRAYPSLSNMPCQPERICLACPCLSATPAYALLSIPACITTNPTLTATSL